MAVTKNSNLSPTYFRLWWCVLIIFEFLFRNCIHVNNWNSKLTTNSWSNQMMTSRIEDTWNNMDYLLLRNDKLMKLLHDGYHILYMINFFSNWRLPLAFWLVDTFNLLWYGWMNPPTASEWYVKFGITYEITFVVYWNVELLSAAIIILFGHICLALFVRRLLWNPW